MTPSADPSPPQPSSSLEILLPEPDSAPGAEVEVAAEPSPQPTPPSTQLAPNTEEEEIVVALGLGPTVLSTEHPYGSKPLTTSTPVKKEPAARSPSPPKVKGRQKRPCPIPECKGALHVNMWNHIFQTHKSQGKYSSKFPIVALLYTINC